MTTITVKHSGGAYEVIVRPGALAQLGQIVRKVAPERRAMLVVDSKIAASHGRVAEQSLTSAGFELGRIELKATEDHKTLEAAQQIYEAMLKARISRNCPLVALGGGIVGDVAGFAAATFLRGVPLVQVPTTLLAMVDASIGGKTGVNMPLPKPGAPGAPGAGGGLGKNLVGSFWQPRAVVVDPLVLRTLDQREFRCGLAECVKHGLIADRDYLKFLASRAADLAAQEPDALLELIARSVRIKADIVTRDEREVGERAHLNLGHTFAHAIESVPKLDLRHGEAVAIGLCAAMRCAQEMGRVNGDAAKSLAGLLVRLGLPTSLPKQAKADGLIAAMGYDKKVADGALRLVLPASTGSVQVVTGVPTAAIRAAWSAVGAIE